MLLTGGTVVYDITIPQTVSRNGKFTSVSGKLVRGKLTLYDNNVLKVPGWRFYLPGDEEAGRRGKLILTELRRR